MLFIGYSQIVRHRVLPALRLIKPEARLDIASRSAADSADCAGPGQVFGAYQEALDKSPEKTVYISTRNHDHGEWARKALHSGRHVIVDKPATLDLHETEELVALAHTKGLCLAESTVYAWHPQVHAIRSAFSAAGEGPTHISATFSFPPMAEGNFRYQPDCGGGALWDLGAYALTPGRLFFASEPVDIVCRVASTHATTGVDTSFSMLAVYPEGQSMVGYFGFASEYRNRINLLSSGMSLEVDRIFTTPATLSNELRVRQANRERIITADAGDPFRLFLTDILGAIAAGDRGAYARFAADMVEDARCMRAARRAAGVE